MAERAYRQNAYCSTPQAKWLLCRSLNFKAQKFHKWARNQVLEGQETDIKVFSYLYVIITSCHLTDTHTQREPKPLRSLHPDCPPHPRQVCTLQHRRRWLGRGQEDQKRTEEPCCFLPQASHDGAAPLFTCRVWADLSRKITRAQVKLTSALPARRNCASSPKNSRLDKVWVNLYYFRVCASVSLPLRGEGCGGGRFGRWGYE